MIHCWFLGSTTKRLLYKNQNQHTASFMFPLIPKPYIWNKTRLHWQNFIVFSLHSRHADYFEQCYMGEATVWSHFSYVVNVTCMHTAQCHFDMRTGLNLVSQTLILHHWFNYTIERKKPSCSAES